MIYNVHKNTFCPKVGCNLHRIHMYKTHFTKFTNTENGKEMETKRALDRCVC